MILYCASLNMLIIYQTVVYYSDANFERLFHHNKFHAEWGEMSQQTVDAYDWTMIGFL